MFKCGFWKKRNPPNHDNLEGFSGGRGAALDYIIVLIQSTMKFLFIKAIIMAPTMIKVATTSRLSLFFCLFLIIVLNWFGIKFEKGVKPTLISNLTYW